MSEEPKRREEICLLAKSMFDRRPIHGSGGNIFVRLSEGSLLVTPTGALLGLVDPARGLKPRLLSPRQISELNSRFG
mgnify:CR=1 FL=1